MLADLLVCPIAVWISFYLRLGRVIGLSEEFWLVSAVSAGLVLPILYFCDLYRVVLRHARWSVLTDLARAIATYGVIFALIFTIIGVDGIPRTLGIIQPIMLFLGIGCSRAIVGYWLGISIRRQHSGRPRKAVLIYGAGAAGRQLADAIDHSDRYKLCGFIDDSPRIQGRRIGRFMVYAPDAIRGLVIRHGIEETFLAIPSAKRSRRTEIVHMLYEHELAVRTLPGLIDLASGKIEVSDLRPLEIEDLLGRDVVAPDADLLARDIEGKTVMVTGAGGSIGSELCRQVARARPRHLLLIENSEFALYAIDQELRALHVGLDLVPLLSSVRDARRMDAIIAAWGVDTIYHAAAYKHVPLVEHNPAEGVTNNIFGTLVLARMAVKHAVGKFVLISTDKAVRPTNIMGASKRVAEMILQALALQGSATCMTMVRFGNVLGSSGSVVPLFRKQIENGGPITITDREITRYFMTIPEAAQLVIQAGAMADGGEVFVLDMGEPVRIIDLATRMIELAGLSVRSKDTPDGEIEIREVGLRPGEKLYEELLIGDNPEPTRHPRVLKANEKFIGIEELQPSLDLLQKCVDENTVSRLKSILVDLVGDYHTNSDIVDWVSLRSHG